MKSLGRALEPSLIVRRPEIGRPQHDAQDSAGEEKAHHRVMMGFVPNTPPARRSGDVLHAQAPSTHGHLARTEVTAWFQAAAVVRG